MASPEILKIVAGVSTVLGLLSLIAFWQFWFLYSRAEKSVSQLIEGDALFSAKQILAILKQFKNDAERLAALKEITTYGTKRTAEFLDKVEHNVDVLKFQRASNTNYQRIAGSAAIFFIIVAILALISITLPRSPNTNLVPQPSPVDPAPSKKVVDLPTKTCPRIGAARGPTPGCDCGDPRANVTPWTAIDEQTRSDAQGLIHGNLREKVGIKFSANDICKGQSFNGSESYINWGDGSNNETLGDVLEGCREHQYRTDGNFEIKVKLSLVCLDAGRSPICQQRCAAEGRVNALIAADTRGVAVKN